MKDKITIYGMGTIGSCLATLTTGNGFPTVMLSPFEEEIETCRQAFLNNWDDLIGQGVADASNKEHAYSLLTLTTDPEEARGSVFAYEASSEKLEIKEKVYGVLEEVLDEDAVIASTTSSISADILAPLFRHPERFVVAHPFQPAHLQPLVELVKHPGTSQAAMDKAYSILSQLHREIVIMNKSIPGFLVNRLAQTLFRECIYMIEQGVTTAEDIDKAVKYTVGMRYASIGLLEYFDAVGYELECAIASNVYPDLCGTTEIQDLVKEGLASGNTGKKAGRGLFDWSKKDEADYRNRLQGPFFPLAKEWDLP